MFFRLQLTTDMVPRKFRLCRSRIGTIFFIILTCALIMFAVNYLSSSPKLLDDTKKDNEYNIFGGGKEIYHELDVLGDGWGLKRKPVRTHKGNRLVYEDEEEQETIQVNLIYCNQQLQCMIFTWIDLHRQFHYM